MFKNTDKKIRIQNTSRGFTLVETLVAMLIFTTVVIFGISALVSMTRDYRVTAEIRQSLDSMNYVMEDISRNVRLGTVFTVTCSTFTDLETPNECPTPTLFGAQDALGLGFQAWDSVPDVNEHEIVYLIDSEHLYKASAQTGSFAGNVSISSPLFVQITPNNVKIDGVKSGFSINNNTSPYLVPVVSIRLAGTVTYQSTTIPFDIQTTIAPRNRQ